MTHWSVGGEDAGEGAQVGVWQYCSEVSGEALEDFMLEYPYTDSPEPNAALSPAAASGQVGPAVLPERGSPPA